MSYPVYENPHAVCTRCGAERDGAGALEWAERHQAWHDSGERLMDPQDEQTLADVTNAFHRARAAVEADGPWDGWTDGDDRWLTTPELAAHLRRITFMPGWTITVSDGRWEGQHIRIQGTVPDAVRPGQTADLDVHSSLPHMTDTHAFEQWLLHRLIRVMSHEAREWLKRDGKPIADPHADQADQDL